MAKLTLTDITAGYLSVAVYNANNTLMETALENTLSRDGTSPNTMSANMDMNSNRITNMTDGTGAQDAVTLVQVQAMSSLVNELSDMDDVASAAITSGYVLVANGTAYVGQALTIAEVSDLAAGTVTFTNKTIDGDNNTITNLDLGNEVDWAAADDVTTRGAFASGDKILIYEAGVGMRKVDYDDLPGAGGGLSNIIEDVTPQLGGNLDAQSKNITALAALTMDGACTIEDAANASSIIISHDGTDANITGTVTTDLNISNDFTSINVAANIYQTGGHSFRVYDSGDDDFLSIIHSGTLATITTAGTGVGKVPLDFDSLLCLGMRIGESAYQNADEVVSANAVTLTYADGPGFDVDMEAATAAITITISGGPATADYGVISVRVQQDGATAQTITWAGGTFIWADGTAWPVTTTLDGVSIFTFETWDAGTTWAGSGADYS